MSRGGRRLVRCALVASVMAALTTACGSSEPAARTAPDGTALRPVALPDISRMDEPVQQQMRSQFAVLTEQIEAPDTAPADLAAEYGRMGMLLQAAEYYDSAEPCLLNAQALAPNELRWPYFLGHLYKNVGRAEDSVEAFRRALELRPNDVPALVELGNLYLDQGRPDAAEPLFTRALAQPPRQVAVLAGLGQVALAKQQYQQAVDYLEEALTLDPTASSVHSPLALAYRGLGELDKAEAHLAQWSDKDVLVPDPLRTELDLILESGLSYELRGIRAFEAKDWNGAAEFFRRGLELTADDSPLKRSLRHKLGTALYLSGDARGALEQFREVVRLSPTEGLDESAARAHYSIGVLMASSGRDEEAIEHLTAAVKYAPTYVEALQALADALRRAGRDEEALPHYQKIIELSPQAADAKFGYDMALVRLGRYREAYDHLTRDMRLHPDYEIFRLAVARLLAAAPDDRVRDGEQAMRLVQQLLRGGRNLQLGETYAMALAELGDYQSAAELQQELIAQAGRAGMTAIAQQMRDNLQQYERGRPCRTPWRPGDPVYHPGPPVDPDLQGTLQE